MTVSGSVNPYQPTTLTSVETDLVAESLAGCFPNGDIEFAGTATSSDVEELLRLTAPPGMFVLRLLPIILGCLAILMNAPWPWVGVAIGVAMLFLVMVSMLSRSYRRAEFYAFNPHTERPCRGRVDARGYQVDENAVRCTVIWTGVVNAYASEQLIAFRAAFRENIYRIIPRHFVADDGQWKMLYEVAEKIHCDESAERRVKARTTAARARMVAADRPWIVSPPDQAVRFSGPITGADIENYEMPASQLRVHYRAGFYGLIGFLAIAALLTGFAGLLLPVFGFRIDPLAIALLAITAVGVTLGTVFWRIEKRQRSSSNLHFYQLGYATDESLTVEFGNVSLTTGWQRLQPFKQDEALLTLIDFDHQRYITVRAEMFESHADWDWFRRRATNSRFS